MNKASRKYIHEVKKYLINNSNKSAIVKETKMFLKDYEASLSNFSYQDLILNFGDPASYHEPLTEKDLVKIHSSFMIKTALLILCCSILAGTGIYYYRIIHSSVNDQITIIDSEPVIVEEINY